jgi:bla regulator protein blaR1
MSAAWTGPLLDHVWQSTWVAFACTLLALGLRHREARLRSTLWCAAIVKFLVPWAALASLGHAMNVWSHADIPPARPNGAFVMDALAQPFTQERFATPAVPAVEGLPPGALTAAALAVWAAGALFFIARWVVRWLRLRQVVRTATLAGSGRELEVFRRVQQRDPRFAHVALALTEQPFGPGVAGSVWPVVLWPRAISDRLSDDEMASVFEHELCHVRRRDNLLSALVRAAETVFWFHPFVWMLGRRLHDERERACDEGVVARMPPDVYAEALVKTCQFHLETPLTCAAAGTPGTFSGRIARILRSGRQPASPWLRRSVAAVAVAALAIPVAVAAVMPPEMIGLGPSRFLQSPEMLVAWAPRATSPVARAEERFVSVSVRPSASSTPGGLQAFGGGRLAGTGVSVDDMIRTAYGGRKVLRPHEVIGLPDWTTRERFDLRARAASDFVNEPSGEPRQFATMLQHLLTDQFGVAVHRERRRLPVYVLVRAGASLGPGLRASELECWRPGEEPVPAIPVHPTRWCHSQFLRTGITEAASMEWLANVVAYRQRLDRPVLDRTGLTGPYDIAWAPPAPGAPVGPALEAQLGLTLAESVEPVDLLVVDHVERPRSTLLVRFGK